MLWTPGEREEAFRFLLTQRQKAAGAQPQEQVSNILSPVVPLKSYVSGYKMV